MNENGKLGNRNNAVMGNEKKRDKIRNRNVP